MWIIERMRLNNRIDKIYMMVKNKINKRMELEFVIYA